MTRLARILIGATLLLPGRTSLAGQDIDRDNKLAQEADAYLKGELSSKRIPGMSICVVRNGKTLLERGYGYANLELSVPASEHTVYELASLTKPFTAVVIMMLVEDGKLSLQDHLSKYFPTAPPAWQDITIEHLLQHTSGFGDFFSIPELQSKSDFAWDREYQPPDLLPIIFKVPIQSQPGERWSYSNVGYYLLGWIIEQVTGEPYELILKHRIFDPLQMTETCRMNRRDIIPNRASGYTWENNTLRNAKITSATWAYSEGGLVSSVSDLAKADPGLFGERLLKRAMLDRMWQPTRLRTGALTSYGYGWNLGSNPQRLQIYHSGNKPGFSAIIRHYIDDRLTVVLLFNADNAFKPDGDVGAISYHVANIFLPVVKPH